MNAYELISPKTGKPCGVFACGICNFVVAEDLAENCCKPCDCGKPSRNRFEGRCHDCCDVLYKERMKKALEEAELVEWDGEMIFSEQVSGYRDGWFDSPDDLNDYIEDEEIENRPEFAFVGRKVVKMLELARAIEEITEDTFEDAELDIDNKDWEELQTAVDKFNSKYALTYYEHDYTKKVRLLPN